MAQTVLFQIFHNDINCETGAYCSYKDCILSKSVVNTFSVDTGDEKAIGSKSNSAEYCH